MKINPERRFSTGKPCKYGHISERYVANGGCVFCQAIKRIQWRKNNSEKVLAQARALRAAYPDRMRGYRAKWRIANPEKQRKWLAANKDKIRQYAASWYAANPEKVRAKNALRRARKKGAIIYLTQEEIVRVNEIYRQCVLMTKLTGIQYHVDHKIAIAKGGKHHPNNLQLLTATENRQKGCN